MLRLERRDCLVSVAYMIDGLFWVRNGAGKFVSVFSYASCHDSMWGGGGSRVKLSEV
jgi:hypothetical protein